MNLKTKLYLAGFFISSAACGNEAFQPAKAWQELNSNLVTHYAYLGDFEGYQQSKQLFAAKLENIKTKQGFIDLSQAYLRHFTDPHLNMGPLNEDDYIVYPTGADLYAEFVGGIAVIQDVKRDSAADIAGLRPGNTVASINNQTVTAAVEDVMQVPFSSLSHQQRNYALNVALGGKRYQPRTIELIKQGEITKVTLAASYDAINALSDGPKVSFNKLGDFGYIRFNNAMGNEQTVVEFTKALQALGKVTGYILDLRNTPSGGNTGVAEPILGHFTDSKAVYQQYRTQTPATNYQSAVLEQAFATPQQPQVTVPFVVLAGRWTGSIGEGMTIGFDALGAKAIIGAPMADLLGGIKRLSLNDSGAWVEVGFERLYHADGSFREAFEPDMLRRGDMDKNGNDVALETAIKVLGQNIQ
ncbi:S41 family peptidase [Pseudoalteromonas piscicida]|uniref:Carboxyl-terminal protease n=1 Tax=Pseudoalteromonas piscicida TaxID=43662 RepID=A0A2A5JSH2_PSEO7|nr:S41 family peptidase [Pseudoalteromonas piscicida]PCK32337.1 carboxyl-terminal protease [Pseudoalteromonas piscicida]